jgi:D-lactate dehydrogenase (cytochrome)
MTLLSKGVRQIPRFVTRTNQNVPGAMVRVRMQSNTTVSSSGSRLFTALVTASVVGGVGGFLAADMLFPDSKTLVQKDYVKPKYGGPKEVAAAKKELKELLLPVGEDKRERISDDKKTLEIYGYSHNSYHPEHLHSMVVHVLSTEDVVKVVKVARKYRIPVTAYSGGTSLEGHFSGVRL